MWTAAQMWFVRATTAAAFIVIGRQLQPSEFGLVALAMSVIAVLQLLSDTGMANYLVRSQHVDERHRSTAFWTSLVLAGALAGLLALLAGALAHLFHEDDLAPVLRWLALTMVLTGLGSVPNALLRRDMQFKSLAVRGAVATVVGSVVAIVLALAGAGVWALVAQNLVRGAVTVVITWTVVRWRPHFVLDRSEARSMLSFGTKLMGMDLLLNARSRGTDFVLAGMGSSVLLGYWSIANRLVKIIQDTGSSVVSTVATPAFAKLQGDRERLARAYSTAMYSAGLVMFPATLFLTVTSPDLVPLLLGQQWADAAQVAQIVAATAALAVFSQFDRSIFIAVDRLRPEMVMVAGIVVSHVVIVVLLVPHGLTWVALGLLARQVLSLPVRQLVIRREAGIPLRSTVPALRVLLASLVMAGALVGAGALAHGVDTWVRVVVQVLVAALVYPPALWLVARPVFRRALVDVRALRGGRRAADVTGPAAPGATTPDDVVTVGAGGDPSIEAAPEGRR
nr:lipopolysaccharide biosynthesis protein [Kineococcus aurantiacus]